MLLSGSCLLGSVEKILQDVEQHMLFVIPKKNCKQVLINNNLISSNIISEQFATQHPTQTNHRGHDHGYRYGQIIPLPPLKQGYAQFTTPIAHSTAAAAVSPAFRTKLPTAEKPHVFALTASCAAHVLRAHPSAPSVHPPCFAHFCFSPFARCPLP